MTPTSWTEPVPIVGSTSAVSFGKLSGKIIRRLKWHRQISMFKHTFISAETTRREQWGRVRERIYSRILFNGYGDKRQFRKWVILFRIHPRTHSGTFRPYTNFVQIQKQWKHNPRHKMFFSSFNVVPMRQADTKKGSMNFCLAFCNYLNANTERMVLALPFWIPICIGFHQRLLHGGWEGYTLKFIMPRKWTSFKVKCGCTYECGNHLAVLEGAVKATMSVTMLNCCDNLKFYQNKVNHEDYLGIIQNCL